MTRLKSHSYGGALECRNTLPAEAVAPQPFTVWARLGVGEVVAEDANQKVKSVSDQFDFMVKTLPTFPAISYSTTCTGGQPGTTSDYGTPIVQLLHVFNRTQYSGSVALNRMGDTRRLPAVDVFGSMTGERGVGAARDARALRELPVQVTMAPHPHVSARRGDALWALVLLPRCSPCSCIRPHTRRSSP